MHTKVLRKKDTTHTTFFYVHMTVHRNKFLFNKTNRRNNFQIYSGTQLYMFRAPPLPIIRSYPDDGQGSGRQTCIKCTSAECTVDNS
jgi:hypothetical protein